VHDGIVAGTANVWAPMSSDEERGLLFLPTSSPSPDFWGGRRPGNDEHANSVVALRAETGELVWSFQTTHHDVWDYDLPAQPTLARIDTGAGIFFGPTVGKLLNNLEASGYRPEQVDEVYITHMHLDHIGGLIKDGKRVFPNAVVRAAQQEADYWLSKAHREAAPEGAKGDFDAAIKALQPYVSAGKFKPFDGDANLVPGIRAVAAPGHTPGHTVYLAESKGQTLVLWGDSDQIVEADYGRAYAAAIPMARFQLLSETGHSAQLETPDQVMRAIWDSADV